MISMKKKTDNRGFSLVELIVVMVIVVILATAVVVAFVNSDGQKLKSSSDLISKYLDNTLNYSLTKGNVYFELSYDEKSSRYKVYVKDSTKDSEDDKDVISSENLPSGIKIKYHIQNAEGDLKIPDDSANLKFSFYRDRGSYTPIIIGINDDGSFVYMSDMFADSIEIESGDSSRTIKLYTKTGAYEIKE